MRAKPTLCNMMRKYLRLDELEYPQWQRKRDARCDAERAEWESIVNERNDAERAEREEREKRY